MFRTEDIASLLRFVLADKQQKDRLLAEHDSFRHITDWQEIYTLFEKHAILPLTAELAPLIPEEYAAVKKDWNDSIQSNVCQYLRLSQQQELLLGAFRENNIPVVVLKGTSASQYYPVPECRQMGDMDLLVRPEDYDRAVSCLLDSGCEETTSVGEAKTGRHRSFRCNSIPAELHRHFSSHIMPENAEKLDRMLFDGIETGKTVLPDMLNGIVLIEHVAQHLEGGLGFRQIVDWWMFADKCLGDTEWEQEFSALADRVGMVPLAKTVTRMCQLYLGLRPDITWCRDADEQRCAELMEYVLNCGNFGRNRELEQSESASTMPTLAHPVQLFRFVQNHGERYWKALQKHPWLKPFAWIYQSCRYVKTAVTRKIGFRKLKSIYGEGQKRNDLFAALGIK